MSATDVRKAGQGRSKTIARRIYESRYTYLFLLPGILFLATFAYWPMYGVTLAFKNYKMNLGIMGSPWATPLFKHFGTLLNDKNFWAAFGNTFRMGFFYIVTGFPAPILLAMLLNELRAERYKRVLQIVYTFPNFLSWVLIGGIMISFLSSDGLVNAVLAAAGLPKKEFLTSTALIRPMLYASAVWKGAGWSSIIYLAAMAGINPELYEAAEIDGASRFGKMRHITWPGIKPTATILLVLAFGGILNNGFDQILNMVNPVVKDAAEVLDTYIYRKTFLSTPNYGLSTAMGLFKAAVNLVFLLAANRMTVLLGGERVL